jgi:hypothetical protein
MIASSRLKPFSWMLRPCRPPCRPTSPPQQDVFEREGDQRDFMHPRHDLLVCAQITLKPAHRDDLKLVVLV